MRTTRRRFGLLSVAATSLEAQAQPAPAYLAETIAELGKQWPKNRLVNLVCHGHSVPAGYFHTPVVRSFEAYPHLIHRGLNMAYPNAVINVIVTAIGGENSKAGAARFGAEVLTHRPDVLTIDYALNDRRLPLAEAAGYWNAMIAEAKKNGVKVILMTPTADIATDLSDNNSPLAQHAAQIRRLAQENNVALADPFEAFRRSVAGGQDVRYLLSQSNHPNLDGHRLAAAEVLKWFQQPG